MLLFLPFLGVIRDPRFSGSLRECARTLTTYHGTNDKAVRQITNLYAAHHMAGTTCPSIFVPWDVTQPPSSHVSLVDQTNAHWLRNTSRFSRMAITMPGVTHFRAGLMTRLEQPSNRLRAQLSQEPPQTIPSEQPDRYLSEIETADQHSSAYNGISFLGLRQGVPVGRTTNQPTLQIMRWWRIADSRNSRTDPFACVFSGAAASK
jgi:hypothetical protein